MYQVRLPRALGGRMGFGSLEQIPGSKELFVGLACASLAVLAPAIAGGCRRRTGRARGPPLWRFCDGLPADAGAGPDRRRGDQLVGRETLAGYMGLRRAERLYFLLSAVIIVVLLAGGDAEWLTGLSFALSLRSMGWPVRGGAQAGVEGESAEALVDGQLYLAGLIALPWAWPHGIR